MRRRLSPLILLALTLVLGATTACAQQKNGFDLGNAEIPVDEIMRGGPPKDGIPAILEPKYESADNAQLWREGDLMLTYDIGGHHYAYPVGILNWHEIVNDTVNGQPLLITFCPLCGTGIAFDPVVDGEPLTFGVSGLLYNSDLLMYDHQTESLWSQIEGRAVAGPLVGKTLEPLPIRHELWLQWRERTRESGQVLSTDTGHSRNYRMSPYGDYDHSERLFFPVSRESQRYHPKTWVLGWTHNGESKAWPFPELAKRDQPLTDEVGGKQVVVSYDASVPTAELRSASGELIPAIRAFWFAWYTFHPDAAVFEQP